MSRLFSAMAEDIDHPGWCFVCLFLAILSGVVI